MENLPVGLFSPKSSLNVPRLLQPLERRLETLARRTERDAELALCFGVVDEPVLRRVRNDVRIVRQRHLDRRREFREALDEAVRERDRELLLAEDVVGR